MRQAGWALCHPFVTTIVKRRWQHGLPRHDDTVVGFPLLLITLRRVIFCPDTLLFKGKANMEQRRKIAYGAIEYTPICFAVRV